MKTIQLSKTFDLDAPVNVGAVLKINEFICENKFEKALETI